MSQHSARSSQRIPSSDHFGGRQRQRCIEAILSDVARRTDNSGAVDLAAIERAHAELMPELATSLHLLLAARQRAQSIDPEQTPADPVEAVLDGEFSLLRQAMKPYELLERIRYGGQGVVYRARQRSTGRIVALKVLLDGPLATERQRARFAREIQLVARLRHPNLVTVYESGVVRGRHFYAMEFVEGDAIDNYAALADLTPAAIVRLLVKVCGAVQHAHRNGIIHRDLNPSNILVDPSGEPRVFDFGLAKDLWAEDDAQVSFAGLGCGTLPYLSPEQAGAGDGQTDVRSDVYALGLVLYELLTDMFPYPVRGEASVVRRAIIHDEPLPLRQALAQGDVDFAPGRHMIDRDLEAILARALAKSKDERYQTAAALADDLERWLVHDAVSARSDSGLYRLRKVVRKHKVAVGFAAVILAAATVSATGITHYWLQARGERDQARVQRDNASRAAQVAYDLFDVTLTDVEEAVRPLAGGVAVRDRLVRRLSDQLPELERLAVANGGLEPVATRLLEKQGDIASQQGRRAEARQYYEAFLDDSLRSAAAASDGVEPAAAVVRAYRKLGDVSDEPLPAFERGLQFGEDALRRVPADGETRYELCRLVLALELHLQNSGRSPKALPLTERALQLCPGEDDASSSAELRWQRALAEAQTIRGLVLQTLGQGAEARVAIERGLALREQIVAANPSNAEARLTLLWSYRDWAKVQRDAGEIEQAKDFLRRAAAQGETLALMDPSSTASARGRYGVYHCLASLCIDTGDLPEAQRACAKSLALAEQLNGSVEGDPTQTTLYFALVLKGKLHRAERDWEAASQCYQAALTLAERQVERDPNSLDSMAYVAEACDALAYCARRLENPTVALAHRQRARALQQHLFALQPESVERGLNLAQAEINLAAVHIDLGAIQNRVQAAELLAAAERHLSELRVGGMLVGMERKHTYLLQAIQEQHATLEACESSGAGGESARSAVNQTKQ